MVLLAAKITLALALLVGWFGFLLPYMISSTNSFLVFAGFILSAFGLTFGILYASREFINFQIRCERENR